ncbi:MAG: hypothetical protein ABI634_02705 [Acidobacteriota bacterium]
MNPNSTHQRWSAWTFVVQARADKRPARLEVVDNARRFFRAGFKSTVGRLQVEVTGSRYVIAVQIEGPPCHDPAYRLHVAGEVRERFVRPGFGPGARLVQMDVRLLAGTAEDGQPAAQLLVLPSIYFDEPVVTP